MSVVGVSTEADITHDKNVWECLTQSLNSHNDGRVDGIRTAASDILQIRNTIIRKLEKWSMQEWTRTGPTPLLLVPGPIQSNQVRFEETSWRVPMLDISEIFNNWCWKDVVLYHYILANTAQRMMFMDWDQERPVLDRSSREPALTKSLNSHLFQQYNKLV